MGGRKSSKKLSAMSEEDIEEYRGIKRARNRSAAAKIRKRVLERTSVLTQEAKSEEQKKQDLMDEMNRLLNTSQELSKLLQEHHIFCQNSEVRITNQSPCNSSSNSTSSISRNKFSHVPSNNPTNVFSNVAHTNSNDNPSNIPSNGSCHNSNKTFISNGSSSPSNSFSNVVSNISNAPSNSPSNSLSNSSCHGSNNVTSNVYSISNGPLNSKRFSNIAYIDPSNNISNDRIYSLSNSVAVTEDKYESSLSPSKPRRPTFLAIGETSFSNDNNSNKNSEGYKTVETPAFMKSVPESIEPDIATPSDGIKLNFESMMEGGTGLTPVNNPTRTFCSF